MRNEQKIKELRAKVKYYHVRSDQNVHGFCPGVGTENRLRLFTPEFGSYFNNNAQEVTEKQCIAIRTFMERTK